MVCALTSSTRSFDSRKNSQSGLRVAGLLGCPVAHQISRAGWRHAPVTNTHLFVRAAAQGFAVLDIRRKHITSNW